MINFNSSYDDKAIWKDVFVAAIGSGSTSEGATAKADDALFEFRARMVVPPPKINPAPASIPTSFFGSD